MNSVELIAVTKSKIDSIYRYIEYALPAFNQDNKNSQVIVARFWPNMPDCRFSSMEEGKKIAVRGHLDALEKYGTILIVEQFEVLN